MITVCTLLITNNLLQIEFNDTLAKEELKLINDEYIKSHLDIFDDKSSSQAAKAT